jgi:hypothetical protein
MSRNTRLIALLGLGFIAVVVVVVNVVQGQQLSPQDKAMKATAHRFAAALQEPDARYSAITDSLQAFNRFQHDEQSILATRMKSLSGPGEFAQVLVWETTTMPTVSLLLRSTHEPVVNVAADQVTSADKGTSTFTTEDVGGTQYRVYLTALQPPPSIKALGGHEILEILRAA